MEEYQPTFTITNEILKYVSSISEKTGRITATRACLKIHSSHLHAPLCGIHLAESIFQTRSSNRCDFIDKSATTDYCHVDNLLGGNEKFRVLVPPRFFPAAEELTHCQKFFVAGLTTGSVKRVKLLRQGV